MIAYWAMYLGALLVRAIKRGHNSLRGGAYWLVLLALFVFAGFRYQVGCDWPNYYGHWLTFQDKGIADALLRPEPGHWLSIIMLHRLGLPYAYMGVLASAIFFAGINHLAKRERDPLAFLVLSFPVLVVNIAMSANRQAEAIGLICFAYGAFIDRKIIRFVAFVLLAYLFHRSALVLLLLAPFVLGSFARKNMLVGAILASPGLYFLRQSDAAEVALSRYYNTGVDAGGAAFRVAVLAITAAAFLLFLSRRWRQAFPKDHDLVTIGAWLMLAALALSPFSSVIADRFGYYLIPLQLMMFARLPYLGLRENRAMIVAAPYLMLTLLFGVWMQLSSHFQYCYAPYQIRFW